jgi:hypothetical protein
MSRHSFSKHGRSHRETENDMRNEQSEEGDDTETDMREEQRADAKRVRAHPRHLAAFGSHHHRSHSHHHSNSCYSSHSRSHSRHNRQRGRSFQGSRSCRELHRRTITRERIHVPRVHTHIIEQHIFPSRRKVVKYQRIVHRERSKCQQQGRSFRCPRHY